MSKLKYYLLIIGALFLAISAFSVYSSQGQFGNSEEDFITINQLGIEHPAWYAFSIFTAILFFIGFFTGHIGAKIAFYILLPVFTFAGSAFAILLTITWGATPFVPQYEFGLFMQIIGCLLIVTATIISMHAYKKKRKEIGQSDLLDH